MKVSVPYSSGVFLASLVLVLSGLIGHEALPFKRPELETEGAQSRTINSIKLQKYANIVPVLIIGSGPAGLGAALQTARDNKSPVIVMGDEPGGLLTKTGEVENWLGMPTLSGQEAIDRVTDQVARYGTKFLFDTVVSIDFASWPFAVHLAGGLTIHALTIVIATGAHPRMLGVAGEQESWGYGVSTCALCDAWAYKGKDVVVVGGGESAIVEAIQLSQHAKSVTMLVRSHRMRATARSQERLQAYPTITIRYGVVVDEIVRASDGNYVTHVRVRDVTTNTSSDIATSGVFLAIGHLPNTHTSASALKLDEHGYIVLKGRTQATSVPGVFAAGDVTDNRYRQAPYAGGTGVAAGIDAGQYLDEIGFTPAVAAILENSPGQIKLKNALSTNMT